MKERWERSRNVARQPAGAASLAVCSSVSRTMVFRRRRRRRSSNPKAQTNKPLRLERDFTLAPQSPRRLSGPAYRWASPTNPTGPTRQREISAHLGCLFGSVGRSEESESREERKAGGDDRCSPPAGKTRPAARSPAGDGDDRGR